jgi:hypothetical protein
MNKRRRFKQTTSLKDRLSEFVADERSKADAAAGCADQYELVKKIHKAGPPRVSSCGRARPGRSGLARRGSARNPVRGRGVTSGRCPGSERSR